ncbi:type VI secretion system tube protein Hcp [Legionella spiritensis]|uniref:Uncharacterized protein n=1 Tax=Legionella spiritensis TaxID=452 RepID=A0A0W0Z9E1_LEGSP|nr:type VI secretion system tube protein Hcp [Legionella spiritensis]KTD65741.1 hypothetical protein Lspi_0453 [Legionella spiritensis]SNV42784.1 Hemolysin-coregulated protein (uncharacterized) [Legionella spiritensis]VEG90602.1 Hemolysin-coregulated protein (uncharacterized) [Legionella spiritensis]
MAKDINDNFGTTPTLPDKDIVKSQYKCMAQITTEASGKINGDSQVVGYETWVELVNYEQRMSRDFDAQNTLIGTPKCEYFRLTTLWTSGGMVPLVQSLFTGEKVVMAEIHCLKAMAGKIEPALQITLENAIVLDNYILYSHVAGPLLCMDIRPKIYRVLDNTKKQEFAYDLTKLMKVG